MKKKLLVGIVTGAILSNVAMAQATLVTIGTAQFGGTGNEYNLIWDDDNNGNSLIWLDYTNPSDGGSDSWDQQKTWAAGLNDVLTYTINSGYTVEWQEDAWRLGSTVDVSADERPFQSYYNGTEMPGFNDTSSEMGHLFYEELANLGWRDTDGNWRDANVIGLLKTGNFENLEPVWFWSETEYGSNTDMSWYFNMNTGYQGIYNKVLTSTGGSGLSLRNAQVSELTTMSTANPVPEPTTFLLLGSGLMGITAIRSRKKEASSQ